MQYWRIGDAGSDLGEKPPYEPDRAAGRVREHAAHYVALVETLLREYHQQHDQVGVISSAYDTELFGHWWFEGVDWLKEVLRGLAKSDGVEVSTASQIIDRYQPERVMALPESSWGSGGNHFTWMNVDTQWMWPPLHEAELRMEQVVTRVPGASGDQEVVLNQAARELLLLQSSDWPFLVTTGQAKEYAAQRFTKHVERFNRLVDLAERGDGLDDGERQFVAKLAERDNPFPTIDYRWFAQRQGKAD